MDLQFWKKISKTHPSEVYTIEGIEQDFMVENLAFFKYAPITSVDQNKVLHGTKIYRVITDRVTNLNKLKKP
jgi:hypothetical protein